MNRLTTMVSFSPRIFSLLLFTLLVLLSACTQQAMLTERENPSSFPSPAEACQAVCRDVQNQTTLVSQCLANPLPDFPDYVCDVAHQPRQPVDDQPENQCSAFRMRKAHHFVEVTPDCEIIRII